jgi:hypothetical protein
MIRINRADFVRQLELVSPGLSNAEDVQQSSCFVFRNGMVLTYNDEVACRTKSLLPPEITGAVKAAPLMKLLQKLTEEEIDIEQRDAGIRILGRDAREIEMVSQGEITLGIGAVERPTTWRPIPPDFCEAVGIIHECAARQKDVNFVLTCVCIAPGWIEACDNLQMARYKTKTGTAQPFLVKCNAIKHIASMGMGHISETAAWVHFKNPAGVILSCRRYVEAYPDLAGQFTFTGTPATLPRGLVEAADKAGVFAEENQDNNRVRIQLRPGRLRVSATGVSGRYAEPKRLKYDGPPLSFMISPKILMEIVKRHLECEVDSTRLRVLAGPLTYCAFLYNPKQEKAHEAA